jgi:hypothetical protein
MQHRTHASSSSSPDSNFLVASYQGVALGTQPRTEKGNNNPTHTFSQSSSGGDKLKNSRSLSRHHPRNNELGINPPQPVPKRSRPSSHHPDPSHTIPVATGTQSSCNETATIYKTCPAPECLFTTQAAARAQQQFTTYVTNGLQQQRLAPRQPSNLSAPRQPSNDSKRRCSALNWDSGARRHPLVVNRSCAGSTAAQSCPRQRGVRRAEQRVLRR